MVWTEAARKILEEREAKRAPIPPVEVAAKTIARAVAEAREDWYLALAKWDKCSTTPIRERVEAYFAEGRGGPATIDPEVEAATATLTRHGDARPAFVARWLSIGGVPAALGVLAHMWGFRQRYESTARPRRPTWLEVIDPADHWDSSVCSAKSDIAELLGHHVSTSSEAVRTAARRAASKLREDAPLPVRIGLARAVDDAAFAAEDTREVLALPKGTYAHDAKDLMRLVDEISLLEGLVERFGFDFSSLRPEIVVSRVGIPAAALLGRFLAKAGSRTQEVELANLLATLECAETARVLVGWLDKKGVDVVAKAFFARRPDLALPVLGSALAGRGKGALYSEPMAKVLLAHHPQTLSAIESRLEPKALTALRALGGTGARASGIDEAEPSELPSVLVSGPSPARKKPRARLEPPPWLDPAVLPPVLLRGSTRRLPPSAVVHLSALLAWSDAPHDALEKVKAACTPGATSSRATRSSSHSRSSLATCTPRRRPNVRRELSNACAGSKSRRARS